jgi:D-xylose transport system substrate-binding protein
MNAMKLHVLILILLTQFLAIKAQDSLKLGFSLGDFSVDRWITDRDYFKADANASGANVLFEYGYGDADQQLEQCRKLVDEGIKVLLIVPTDCEKIASAIEYAHSKNVIVIAYDRLIKNCDLDYYISFDNVKVGELQAQYAVNLKPKGNYVLLAGPKSDNNALLFLQGQHNILDPLEKRGDIVIVYEKQLIEWSSIHAFDEMQSFLDNQGNKIDVIVASNDNLAGGAIMALDMHSDDWNIVITGQDATIEACQNILAGKQSMTVYKPIKKLAQEAASVAVKLSKGEVIDNISGILNNGIKNVPSILLEPIAVDKNNLKETVIADGFVREDKL